jgi:hypothetical protein
MNAVKIRELGSNVSGYPVWLCRTTWGKWSIDEPNMVSVFTSEQDAVAYGLQRLRIATGPPIMCQSKIHSSTTVLDVKA